jgi:hypothetical protein
MMKIVQLSYRQIEASGFYDLVSNSNAHPSSSLFVVLFNPFTAKVVNKQLLGRPPKWLFGTVAQKQTLIFLSKLLY